MTVTFISKDHITAQLIKTAVPDAEPINNTKHMRFKRGMCEIPRIGESIRINNRMYRVVDVVHELSPTQCCTEHKATYAYLEVRGYE